MTIVEAYELGDDGFCPKYCAQCDINKKCKKCKEGYNLIGTKDDDDKPIICDNTINIESELYYKNKNSYYLCNEECNGCIGKYNYCLSCKDFQQFESMGECVNSCEDQDLYEENGIGPDDEVKKLEVLKNDFDCIDPGDGSTILISIEGEGPVDSYDSGYDQESFNDDYEESYKRSSR